MATTTVLFFGDSRAASWPNPDKVNTFIRSLASDDVLVMDAYTRLADENGSFLPQYGADYRHTNKAWYQVLNKYLAELIEPTASFKYR